MSAVKYLDSIDKVMKEIYSSQLEQIKEAAKIMADSIVQGGVIHVFGSGHSVIPALDIFPRYGSYLGFHPLLDPRLMWFNVTGSGGAQELLWLERQEGYINVFLKSYEFKNNDAMLIFSHGGLNAAPVETGLAAKDAGLPVIAVTSMENQQEASPTHSSGKKLSDIADINIDNCVPPEDALVNLDGQREPVSAGSTVAFVTIAQAMVAETAKILIEKGVELDTFVSPNVEGVPEEHNQKVFVKYQERLR